MYNHLSYWIFPWEISKFPFLGKVKSTPSTKGFSLALLTFAHIFLWPDNSLPEEIQKVATKGVSRQYMSIVVCAPTKLCSLCKLTVSSPNPWYRLIESVFPSPRMLYSLFLESQQPDFVCCSSFHPSPTCFTLDEHKLVILYE